MAATMGMHMVEEPMLSRMDRLDTIVRQLEEIRGGGSCRSPAKSSCASSGTLTSDDHPRSSVDFSPRSLEKHCRPIDDVIMETEMKGTLLERLVHVEDRVLKMCLQMEKELEAAEEKEKESNGSLTTTPEKKKKKKGLKQLVKSCVHKAGKGKHN